MCIVAPHRVQENPDIDHAVVLVGYGEEYGKKYWLVRNSWAPTWGEDGYIRIARHDNEEEVCGSDITPQVTRGGRDCDVYRAGLCTSVGFVMAV
jgi:hypothetical protein